MLASVAGDVPVIVLEPACASAFKDELPNLFPGRPDAERLSKRAIAFGDFVAEHFDRFPMARDGGRALVQAHCHHHAILGFEAEMKLIGRLGLEAERSPQGCCGMAGAFGFAEESRELALAIGERSLLPDVRKAEPDRIILADGFSCREQIEQGSGRETLHIAELLAQRMLGEKTSS